MISVQPLIGLTIRRFCIVYTDTVQSNRSQHVMVDSCRSKLVDVVSVVLHGSVIGSALWVFFFLVFSVSIVF